MPSVDVMQPQRDVALAPFTTLRVGGPADIYVEPASEADLAAVLKFCGERGLKFFVLGRGSNLLVRDGVELVEIPAGPEAEPGRWAGAKKGTLVAYAGAVQDGEAVLAPFRALAEPITDMVRPMRYPEIYLPDEEDYHPTAVGHTMFIDRVDRDVAETIFDHLEASDAPMRVAQLRVLGGAMARVPADATAFAHRSSRIMVNLGAFYEGPEDRPAREAWVADFAAALRQSDAGAYVGFLADEGEGRVRRAYPGATWDRLAAIKARYDPMNLFRLNHNIPPDSP